MDPCSGGRLVRAAGSARARVIRARGVRPGRLAGFRPGICHSARRPARKPPAAAPTAAGDRRSRRTAPVRLKTDRSHPPDRPGCTKCRRLLERLEQENRYLEQALAHRGADIELLTARMGEAAARDREELVRLQDELEAEHRIGLEKARLIRSLEAASPAPRPGLHESEAEP